MSEVKDTEEAEREEAAGARGKEDIWRRERQAPGWARERERENKTSLSVLFVFYVKRCHTVTNTQNTPSH